MADGLARAGASVCIWGTSPTKNAAAEAQLRAHCGAVMAAEVDVGDESQVVAAMDVVVERFGALDSCFANAAVTGSFANPRFRDST